MSGDRWVVEHPEHGWTVEKASRRPTGDVFVSYAAALAFARGASQDAGGGGVYRQLSAGAVTAVADVAGTRPLARPRRARPTVPHEMRRTLL